MFLRPTKYLLTAKLMLYRQINQESSAESSTAEAVKGESTDGGSAAERTQSSKEDEVKRKGDERRLSVGSDAQANP